MNSHDLAIIAGATRDIQSLTATHCKDSSETVEPTKAASTVIVANVTQAYVRLLAQNQGLLIHSPIEMYGTPTAVADIWSHIRDVLPSDTVLASKLQEGTRPAVKQGSNTVEQERPYSLSEWYDAMGVGVEFLWRTKEKLPVAPVAVDAVVSKLAVSQLAAAAASGSAACARLTPTATRSVTAVLSSSDGDPVRASMSYRDDRGRASLEKRGLNFRKYTSVACPSQLRRKMLVPRRMIMLESATGIIER